MSNKYTNPIGYLQEYAFQSTGRNFPYYIELPATGPPHKREFSYNCCFGEYIVTGNGLRKKYAKEQAARNMISLLEAKNLSEMDLCGDKNAVSKLKEICEKQKGFPKPLYKEMPQNKNEFKVVCTVGTLSTTGRDTTKKGAKLSSSKKMLTKLLHHSNEIGFAGMKIE